MPSPGSHNIQSFVEINQQKSKGYTFGASNEDYAKVYNKALPEKKGWTDPGLYNIKSFADNIQEGKRRIYFGSRNASSLEKNNIPGPG